MTLHEETLIDHTIGRVKNPNIAEHHLPMNADILGVASSVANAIYHAIGKRVRGLPITFDNVQR